MTITEEVQRRWMDSIIKFIEKEKKLIPERKDGKIYVRLTDLCMECLRVPYYSEKIKDIKIGTIEKLLRKSVGSLYHSPEMSEYHERFIEYPIKNITVRGKIDEYLSDLKIVIDKKTTEKEMTNPYFNHKLQVDYYAVMIKEILKLDVEWGCIIYINILDQKQLPKVFLWEITEERIKKIKEDLIKSAETLSYYLENAELPPTKMSGFCNYCDYVEQCIKDGNHGNGKSKNRKN